MRHKNHDTVQQHIYAVSELTLKIKRLLEGKFPFIWISGEISNFRSPASGHFYFVLKDPGAQVRSVMFRNQARLLKFKPEDGMSIVGLGRISVYEPRGDYQIIFEYLEPRGVGALQIAFEKLKQKLSEEGLFDVAHKSSIPSFPKKISIVTSPTGAAVRDFIKVAQRRFPNLPLEVVPVSVQGDRSPGEIIAAIQTLNRLDTTDVIVLTRGGGSIEDLCGFNDEQLARAIFASKIPIVSAVGHETDFTIADFVADLRAPTPSAASEVVVPSKNDLKNRLLEINQKLYYYTNNKLKTLKNEVLGIRGRLIHPQRRLEDFRMRVDDFTLRLTTVIKDSLGRNRERADFYHTRLKQASPKKTVGLQIDRVKKLQDTLILQMNQLLRDRQSVCAAQEAMLDALNPMAILKRGYSITRTLPRRAVVRNAASVRRGQALEIVLDRGALEVTVNERRENDP